MHRSKHKRTFFSSLVIFFRFLLHQHFPTKCNFRFYFISNCEAKNDLILAHFAFNSILVSFISHVTLPNVFFSVFAFMFPNWHSSIHMFFCYKIKELLSGYVYHREVFYDFHFVASFTNQSKSLSLFHFVEHFFSSFFFTLFFFKKKAQTSFSSESSLFLFSLLCR